jgi:GNAT superfamily N-acetyltransferase
MMPGLEWVAESGVLDEAVHLGCIRGGTCWVAVNEHDILVGFLSAEAIAEHELHIHEMSVSEAFQGQGIGRALLEATIEWAVTHRLAALTLTTFRDVPWNAPFYSRLGFEVLSTSSLSARLAMLLQKEVEDGFAEGSRCVMHLPLDDRIS